MCYQEASSFMRPYRLWKYIQIWILNNNCTILFKSYHRTSRLSYIDWSNKVSIPVGRQTFATSNCKAGSCRFGLLARNRCQLNLYGKMVVVLIAWTKVPNRLVRALNETRSQFSFYLYFLVLIG